LGSVSGAEFHEEIGGCVGEVGDECLAVLLQIFLSLEEIERGDVYALVKRTN
jgi:hypothetical protein